MIIDTDNLQGYSTDELHLAARILIRETIIKAHNVRVILEPIQTLDDVRELDDK